MTFWTFVLIIIAVTLGVNWGLKIHEDPEGFSDFISALLKFVRWLIKYIGLPLLVIGSIILGINRAEDNVDMDKVLKGMDYIIAILFGGGFLYCLWMRIYNKLKEARENLKGKKGFIDICKELYRQRKESRRKKKEAKAKKIAEMSEEELRKYKKHERDLTIIIISFMSPYIIIGLIFLIEWIIG